MKESNLKLAQRDIEEALRTVEEMEEFVDTIDAPKEVLKEKFANCLKKYDNHIKIGGYKTFLDGSPQGRTAWMRTPYLGEEEDYYAYGTQKDEDLKNSLKLALNDNMQVLVHCNGDAACEQYINQFKLAKEETKSTNEIRPVIVSSMLGSITGES